MEIAQWRKIADPIVLMIDLNENITSDTVTEIFANIGLTGDITHHHRATGLVLTHQRGSHPIYGIYTSSTLQVSDIRYLPLGIIPSDHRLLWSKIEFDSAFRAKMDTLVPHTVRRLNFQITDTVKHFIELYKNFIRDNGLHSEIFYLQERLVHKPLTTPLQKI